MSTLIFECMFKSMKNGSVVKSVKSRKHIESSKNFSSKFKLTQISPLLKKLGLSKLDPSNFSLVSVISLMSIGRPFHALGAAMENARSDETSLERGTTRSCLPAERREAHPGMLAPIKLQSSIKV